MSRRTEKVSSLVQMELGELVQRKLKDPRVGLVTITHVDMAPDLKSARVFYSVLGEAKEKSEAGEGLRHAAGFLQHQIAEALKLRFTPKLTFHLDETAEQSIRIEKIIHELHRKEGESE